MLPIVDSPPIKNFNPDLFTSKFMKIWRISDFDGNGCRPEPKQNFKNPPWQKLDAKNMQKKIYVYLAKFFWKVTNKSLEEKEKTCLITKKHFITENFLRLSHKYVQKYVRQIHPQTTFLPEKRHKKNRTGTFNIYIYICNIYVYISV